jgi:hypothetical protein
MAVSHQGNQLAVVARDGNVLRSSHNKNVALLVEGGREREKRLLCAIVQWRSAMPRRRCSRGMPMLLLRAVGRSGFGPDLGAARAPVRFLEAGIESRWIRRSGCRIDGLLCCVNQRLFSDSSIAASGTHGLAAEVVDRTGLPVSVCHPDSFGRSVSVTPDLLRRLFPCSQRFGDSNVQPSESISLRPWHPLSNPSVDGRRTALESWAQDSRNGCATTEFSIFHKMDHPI